EERARRAACECAEHADTGGEQVDVAAGGREGGARSCGRRRADRETGAAEQRGRVRRVAAALRAVPGGGHEQHALPGRVADRGTLGWRGLWPAQAEVDDARAV